MILEAADRLLTASGDVEAVSMAKIADAVGRTQPSVYAHFADKAALITAVCERTFQRLGDYIEADLGGVIDPWDRLDRRARAYVRFAVAHPEHYRLLFSPSARADDSGAKGDLERLSGYAGLVGLRADVAAAIEAGRMVDGNPDVLTLAMWSAVHGLASLFVAHPNANWPPELLDQVLANHALGLTPRA
jgi:AcrR family transcriptional regulator